MCLSEIFVCVKMFREFTLQINISQHLILFKSIKKGDTTKVKQDAAKITSSIISQS